jgi:hypothetical protein
MTDLRTPEERECERCGRREIWDGDAETWRVADRADDGSEDSDAQDTAAGEDPGDAVGDVHCVHEWDIDGSFQPIE